MRRNGGAAGAGGEMVAAIEARGVGNWRGTCSRPGNTDRWAYRACGIESRRRRQRWCWHRSSRPTGSRSHTPTGRGALDAVRHVHRLLNAGYREVVNADLSKYCGEIPHAGLLRSVARRVSDGRLLGWIEACPEMAVEEDDG